MKTKNIELQDEITVDEYKAWLTGLLRGKGSQLPDLNDWKMIKKMTDKIVPEVVEVPAPAWPQYPTPQYPTTPEPQPWWLTQPTCIPPQTWISSGSNSGRIDGDNITIGSLSDAVASTSYAGWGPYGYGAIADNIKIGKDNG